jgi:hypothetical protein
MSSAMSSATSKFPVGIAVLSLSALLLASVPSNLAQARGLHIRIGGSPIGIVRSVASHMLALRGLHGRRGGGRVRMADLRDDASAAMPRVDVSRGAEWVTRPVARVQVAASAAMAGWGGRRGANGWWQHGDGGYGWVGPLFWPFAYYDLYDYTLWGDGIGFWGYGYRDIYAAVFSPYGDDELARYATSSRRRHGRIPQLARICGDDEVASLPVDRLRQAMVLSEEQRAALDDLAGASLEAARIIRAACPAEAALTPSGRLAVMQRRLEAMESAIAGMRPSLEKFYELLDDEQKGKLKALEEQRSKSTPKVPATQSCTPPEALRWPGGEIESRLQLDEVQRAALDGLRLMSAKANDILNFDCQPDENLMPPDRLATADVRLDAMLDAVKLVRPALEDFYATLTDEQKAQFGTIGAKRTS